MASSTAAARRRSRFDLRHQRGFPLMAILCLVFLYGPISVLMLYSFNDNESLFVWGGFSLRWYGVALGNHDIQIAAWTSLKLAFVAAAVSTAMATAAALATTRVNPFRGEISAYMIINLPLLVPEICTAVATLLFFAALGINLGFTTLVLAHICFCIPFAYLPIRARLEDMDKTLEQAAADLYATPWQAFRRVTLPLLMPGILAGGTLAFITSIDDVVISSFVAGSGYQPLPIYIWAQVRNGVRPDINAVSTILLAVSIVFVSLSFYVGQLQKRAR